VRINADISLLRAVYRLNHDNGKKAPPFDTSVSALLRGKTIFPKDEAYASARSVWNAAVDRHPAVFALCETTGQVQAAMRAARAYELPLSVRGGGYDWAGRALRENGLVIDLSGMRHVEIDPVERVAIVGGGALVADVVAAAAAYDLVVATGNCNGVGMVGLTLGGGYGPLTSRCGLALDNLLGAEVVLADGRHITADAIEHPDLFWALRGGGGNFGVVTSIRVRLHPIRELIAGMILFPWSEAETVLRRYGRLIGALPDELTVRAGILTGQDGDPLLFLSPVWSGEAAQSGKALQDLQQLGTPLTVQIDRMTYGELLGMHDAHVAKGRHVAIETRWLPRLSQDVISTIVAAGTNRTSSHTIIALHHFHGAGTRICEDATAFGLRREHFLCEIIAAWEPDSSDDDKVHREWARQLSRKLEPNSLPGGYPNLLGPDKHDQIALAYGGNIIRLRQLKRRFDPGNVFSSAIPLPT
jgi:FAD/FMN-containing dehydrogenase